MATHVLAASAEPATPRGLQGEQPGDLTAPERGVASLSSVAYGVGAGSPGHPPSRARDPPGGGEQGQPKLLHPRRWFWVEAT